MVTTDFHMMWKPRFELGEATGLREGDRLSGTRGLAAGMLSNEFTCLRRLSRKIIRGCRFDKRYHGIDESVVLITQ